MQSDGNLGCRVGEEGEKSAEKSCESRRSGGLRGACWAKRKTRWRVRSESASCGDRRDKRQRKRGPTYLWIVRVKRVRWLYASDVKRRGFVLSSQSNMCGFPSFFISSALERRPLRPLVSWSFTRRITPLFLLDVCTSTSAAAPHTNESRTLGCEPTRNKCGGTCPQTRQGHNVIMTETKSKHRKRRKRLGPFV